MLCYAWCNFDDVLIIDGYRHEMCRTCILYANQQIEAEIQTERYGFDLTWNKKWTKEEEAGYLRMMQCR